MNFKNISKILITGGAGFIGSHVVRLFVKKYPDITIYNLDKLTYAGNLENLRNIESAKNYKFIKGDIVDGDFIHELFETERFDAVIHLAAESHVDRSISNPMEFIMTNIIGTVNLLNASRHFWLNDPLHKDHRFLHVSTDEVFGSLGDTGHFTEETAYDPRSPYSSSKAGSDHLVRAYHHTYGLPILITNCSNNYGPNQFPEKLVPLVFNNILNNLPVPVYGAGENVRDWLYVEDHAQAIEKVFCKGTLGETYVIGGNNEWKNIDLVKALCKIMDKKLEREPGSSEKLITFVKDRAGHDLRYAIDSSRIKNELGWEPALQFEEGLEKTIEWYLSNQKWLEEVTSGNYTKYYEIQYGSR